MASSKWKDIKSKLSPTRQEKIDQEVKEELQRMDENEEETKYAPAEKTGKKAPSSKKKKR